MADKRLASGVVQMAQDTALLRRFGLEPDHEGLLWEDDVAAALRRAMGEVTWTIVDGEQVASVGGEVPDWEFLGNLATSGAVAEMLTQAALTRLRRIAYEMHARTQMSDLRPSSEAER